MVAGGFSGAANSCDLEVGLQAVPFRKSWRVVVNGGWCHSEPSRGIGKRCYVTYHSERNCREESCECPYKYQSLKTDN